MPTAYLAKDKYNHAIQVLSPSTSTSVAVGGSSAASSALSADCNVIRVVATTNCFIKIGTGTPTAADTDLYLPAGMVEYFRVDAGPAKVAVIQESASGTLYITEMV